MKKFVAAALSAVLCLGTLTVPVTASAYDKCDVNRDGKVNIMDTIYFNRYLMMQHYVPDYNRLDVDNTMTIDTNDSMCLLAKVTKNDYSTGYYSKKQGITVSTTVSTAGVYPITASRSYERYSYTSKKKLSSYLLTPTTKQDSNSQNISERKIIDGDDTRYLAVGDENRGIVYLNIPGSFGTGFIVGDHEIATAAHCVYNDENNLFYDIKIQTYNKNGELTSTKLTPVEAHVPSGYMNTAITENPYDYALITVKEDLSEYPHFELVESYNLSSTGFANVPIYITGCPGTVRNSNNSSKRLYSEEGKIIRNVSQNKDVLYNNVDTSGGQSGTPIYTIMKTTVGGEVSYKFVVLAVHQGGLESEGANWGARINRHHKLFYGNNPYANYQ